MALNNVGLGFQVSAKDNASPALQQVADKLGKTNEAAKKAKVSFEDVGGQAKDIGAKMGLVGAAGVAGLGLAASEAAKFEFGVAQVATEADKAKLPMSAISDIAKKMALQYGGDLDTQVKALYQGVAAGADDAAKATALLDGANRLAIAGNTDQATSILGITKVLNNYGMTFDKATDVADAFFVAVKGGQTTVGELGDAVGQVAALGKGAGLSMEELIGALGTAATLGKDTAGSAAAMKAALSGVAHPTADAAKEAERLGIKFNSVELRSKGLVGFLKEITGSSKYTADSMSKLFGSMEASGFMASLAANDGAQLNAMMDGMKNKAGGAQEAFETMSGTMVQQSAILKANVQVALVQMGDAIMPLVKQITSLGTKLVILFTGLPEPVKKAFAGLVALVSVGLLLTGAALGIVSAVAAVAASFEAIAIAAAVAAGLFGIFLVAAGAVIAVGYLLKRAYEQNLGGFADVVDNVVKKVTLAFNALSQLFSSGGFSGAVMQDLRKAENQGIRTFAVTAFLWFNRLKNFFDGVGTGITMVINTLAPTFTRLSKAIQDIMKDLGFAPEVASDARDTFNDFGKAGERVGDIIGVAAEWIAKGMAGVAEMVHGVIQGFKLLSGGTLPLKAALSNLFDSFARIGEAITGTSRSGAQAGDGWKAFGQVVGGVAGFVVSAIVSVINVLATVIAAVVAFVSGFVQLATGIYNVFEGIMGFITAVFLGRWDKAFDYAKQVVYGFVQGVAGVLNALAGTVLAVVDKILGAFGKATNLTKDLKSATGGILNSVQQGLGLNVVAGGQDNRSLAGVGGANPGVAATGATASANAANATAAAANPWTATIPVTVTLDGDKVGEANARYAAGQNQRQGGPAPTQT